MKSAKDILKAGVSIVMTGILGDSEGLVTLATRSGPAKGLRFRLDLQRRQEYPYWFGKYDLEILEVLDRICKPGWVAWDCGVYLGYYSCALARMVGDTGKVIAFEPDPKNLERSKRNAELNHVSNVTFVHAAVGAPCGEIDLVISDNTNSHIPGVYVGKSAESYARIERVDSTIRVPSVSLDDAHFKDGHPRPDVIKIDIEGAERIALQYTDRLCREVKPIFVLELHNPDCDKAAWEWAQRQNYSIRSILTNLPITRAADVQGTLLCSPNGD